MLPAGLGQSGSDHDTDVAGSTRLGRARSHSMTSSAESTRLAALAVP